MEVVYLVVALLCPLSMVAMIGWWAWSMRPKRTADTAAGRSAADDSELARMRVQLGQAAGEGQRV